MNNQKLTPIVWWIIWLGLVVGFCVLYFEPSIGGGVPPKEPGTVSLAAPIVVAILSTVIRWVVIPRFTKRRHAFPFFVMGIALAEFCGFIGLYLIPQYNLYLAALALICMLQFAPIFAARLEA